MVNSEQEDSRIDTGKTLQQHYVLLGAVMLLQTLSRKRVWKRVWKEGLSSKAPAIPVSEPTQQSKSS